VVELENPSFGANDWIAFRQKQGEAILGQVGWRGYMPEDRDDGATSRHRVAATPVLTAA